MTDDSGKLFGSLPSNIKALTTLANRAVDAGKPDYLPAFFCHVGLPRPRVPIVKKAKCCKHKSTDCFFAGMLTEDKGVGDYQDALSILHAEGIKLSMSFAGLGELSKWQARAESLGIVEQVRFLGH